VVFRAQQWALWLEVVNCERSHVYDNLAAANYYLLPESFGCNNRLSAQVSAMTELDQVLVQIEEGY
jgi:hypothetical protein